MAAGVSVGTVVELLGMEGCVDRLRSAGYVFNKSRTFFGADIDDLADMISVGDNAAPWMALLAKENQFAHGELADEDTEDVEQFAAHTVAALAARGFLFGHGSSLVSV